MMNNRRNRPTSRRAHRRRGGVLFEFVMILPLFLFMMMLVMDGARLLLVSSAMSDATYRAARAGAVAGGADMGNSSQLAFNQALGEIPGAHAAGGANATVVRGSVCSNAQPYVEIRSEYQVELLTPMLGGLFELATGQGSSSSWLDNGYLNMDSVAVARCEIAQ